MANFNVNAPRALRALTAISEGGRAYSIRPPICLSPPMWRVALMPFGDALVPTLLFFPIQERVDFQAIQDPLLLNSGQTPRFGPAPGK